MYNCVVFGASGAVGSEFVKFLFKSKNWNKIFIISRSMDPSFEYFKNDQRFRIFTQPDIMDLTELKKELAAQNIHLNGVYNFLGTLVKYGEETFRKIDKEYVLKSCQFASDIGAEHFLHVSAKGVDAKSSFLYLKVKGETVLELQQFKLPYLTVLQPGLIKDRKDERCLEKMFKWVPFYPKIKASVLGEFCQLYTEEVIKKALGKEEKGFELIDNDQMLKMHEELSNRNKS